MGDDLLDCEQPHLLHCNAHRRRRIGGDMCVCEVNPRGTLAKLDAMTPPTATPTEGADLVARIIEATGQYSVSICRGDAELAPPQYLLDAWNAAATIIRSLSAELAKRDAAALNAKVPRAVADIAAERERQQAVEGWTPGHDDSEHGPGTLARAAACYALNAAGVQPPGMNWPWEDKWWKPKDPRRDLVRAGALIVAEIERLDRAAIRGDDERREG